VKNTAGVRHYFVEAFTPSGYISMLQELFEELKYIYIITGGPGSGKATMIKLIGVQLLDRGYDVDYIRSLREPDSVAGLYLPKQRLGLIDEEEFEPLVITKKEGFKRINLELFCDPKRLQEYENRINKLSKG
jgi:dephospho-CoA kinase